MDSLKKDIDIEVFADKEALFAAVAQDFFQYVQGVLKKQNKIYIAFSGGSTPKSFFTQLVNNTKYRTEIPWHRIFVFFVDERYVSATDSRSNYRMASAYLFSKVDLRPENIHRMPTEVSSPQRAATAYQKLLRRVFNIGACDIPRFDLIHLGLGDNAHTASLMPMTEVVRHYCENPEEIDPLVNSLYNPDDDTQRITLMPQVINNAKRIVFLVEGKKKAPAVQQVLQGHYDPLQFPGQLIHAKQGETVWFLDKEAASELKYG